MRKKQEQPKSRARTSARHVTVVDIARAAGVCQATVSYAINDRPGVGPELRKRILAIAKEMNYAPSPAARHLSMSRSEMLGIVIQDLTPGWFLSIFHGMLWKAATTGYHAITVVSTDPGDELDLPMHMVAKTSIDGLLWLDPRATPEAVRKFKAKGIPFVLIQNNPEDPDVNTIASEDRLGSRDAVRHLLKLGYRRLLLITGHKDSASSREKLDGARQALRELNVTVPADRILNGEYSGDIAVQVLETYLDKGNPLPQAIFAFNDNMALAILRWLDRKGIRVPEEVAVVGYDGTDEALQAELTTVETPTRDLGIMAAQLLIDVIGNPSRKAQHILLQGTLCVRRTCGASLRLPK